MDATNDWRTKVAPVVLQLQIINGAMLAGTIGFMAVVLVLGGNQLGNPAGVLGLITLVVAIAVLAVRVVVRRIVDAKARAAYRNSDMAGRYTENAHVEAFGPMAPLAARYFVRIIFGAALLEGGSLFSLVTCLVEGGWLPLAVAVLLMFGIALQMPTKGRMVAWLENQERLANEEEFLR